MRGRKTGIAVCGFVSLVVAAVWGDEGPVANPFRSAPHFAGDAIPVPPRQGRAQGQETQTQELPLAHQTTP